MVCFCILVPMVDGKPPVVYALELLDRLRAQETLSKLPKTIAAVHFETIQYRLWRFTGKSL